MTIEKITIQDGNFTLEYDTETHIFKVLKGLSEPVLSREDIHKAMFFEILELQRQLNRLRAQNDYTNTALS